jgi:hypothetical protein
MSAFPVTRVPLSKEADEKLEKAYILWYRLIDEGGKRPTFETIPGPKAGEVTIFISGKEFTYEDAKKIYLPEDEAVDSPCNLCNGDPCYLKYLEASLDDWAEDYPTDVFCNKEIRYAMYRSSSDLLHGRLGYGVRKPLPKCVEKYIKEKYPEETGEYKGFEYAK